MEISKSFAEYLHNRLNSTLIATYVALWFTWHWQVIHVTLFVDQDKIYEKFGLLKNEYINHYFLTPDFSNIFSFIGYLMGYIVPGILTYLFIWFFPKNLFINAYQKERDHKIAKKLISMEGDKIIKKAELELAEKDADVREQEVREIKAEKQIETIDPNVRLEKEYLDFIASPDGLDILEAIKNTIYKHYGNTEPYYDSDRGVNVSHRLDYNYLAKTHSNGLVNYDKSTRTIELTDKGRYFISKI